MHHRHSYFPRYINIYIFFFTEHKIDEHTLQAFYIHSKIGHTIFNPDLKHHLVSKVFGNPVKYIQHKIFLAAACVYALYKILSILSTKQEQVLICAVHEGKVRA